MHITEWEASRSGAGITVAMTDAGGVRHKQFVKKIVSHQGTVTAFGRDGARFPLNPGRETSAEVASIAGDLLNLNVDELLGMDLDQQQAHVDRVQRFLPRPAPIMADVTTKPDDEHSKTTLDDIIRVFGAMSDSQFAVGASGEFCEDWLAAIVGAAMRGKDAITTLLERERRAVEAFALADKLVCDAIRWNGYYVGDGNLEALAEARAAALTGMGEASA